MQRRRRLQPPAAQLTWSSQWRSQIQGRFQAVGTAGAAWSRTHLIAAEFMHNLNAVASPYCGFTRGRVVEGYVSLQEWLPCTRWLRGELRLPECNTQTGANASDPLIEERALVWKRESTKEWTHTTSRGSVPVTNWVWCQRNFDLAYTVGRIQMRSNLMKPVLL